MVRGLDYSSSHPDAACVKKNGYTFVARYIGDPDPNSEKYLDAAELKVLRTESLGVVVVRETSKGFMLTESGADHARTSRGHCEALGLHGIPIYYALDVDPRALTAAQRTAVGKFLADAALADGGGINVGLYGSDDAMDWWVGQWYCHWGWQTFAWSGGRISSRAHLRQYQNGVNLCGGLVDLNETYTDDFGQWPRPNTPEDEFLTDAQYDEIIRRFDNIQRQIVTRRPVRTQNDPQVWAWDGLERAPVEGEDVLGTQVTLEVLKTNPDDRFGYVISPEVMGKIPVRLSAEMVDDIVRTALTEVPIDVDTDAVITAITAAVTAAVNRAFADLVASLSGSITGSVSGQITFPPAPVEG